MIGAAHIAAFLLNLGDPSHAALRRSVRVFRGHSTGDVFLHLLVEVERELPVELAFDAAAAKKRSQAQDQNVEDALHTDAAPIRSTSPTAFDKRSHCVNSFCNWVRP